MNKFFSVTLLGFVVLFSFQLQAQTTRPSTQPSSQPTSQNMKENNTMIKSPYDSIGEYPADVTSAAVLQRVIDGFGYRYNWATEGLNDTDLAYEPGNEGKSAMEVIKHINSLSKTVLNTVKGLPNVRPESPGPTDFASIRSNTLSNIKEASDYLRANPNLDLENNKIVFARGEKKSEFPFWHLLNGPLLDAVYHTGQIVSYRRSTGNPSNPKVNVFSGKSPKG